MKAVVQIPFKDKETDKIYNVGDKFNGTQDRIDEINKSLNGALELVSEPIVKKRTKKE